jgi:hypothetical protein
MSSIPVVTFLSLTKKKYDPTLECSLRTRLVVDGQDCLIDPLELRIERWPMYKCNLHVTDALVIVFDLSDRKTFLEVRNYFDEAHRLVSKHLPRILVGNKSDLSTEYREVPAEEAISLAQDIGGGYVETSAKVGTNVDKVLVDLVRRHKESTQKDSQPEHVTLIDATDGLQKKKQGWKTRLLGLLGGKKMNQ